VLASTPQPESAQPPARRRQTAAGARASVLARCSTRRANRGRSPRRAGAGRTHGCGPRLQRNDRRGSSIRASLYCIRTRVS
jgi:hypothetical protein